MEALLELKDLSIGFQKPLVDQLSAKMHRGSFCALMGVNGIGKSCLLKTIAQIIPPYKGLIEIKGKNLQNYSSLDLAKVVSVVLTEKIQVDFLRVDELVAFGRSPYTGRNGVLNKDDLQVVEQVIKEAGIEALKNHFFSELSDGQKQKALIARALAQMPQLLILDEPTTYLDIPSKIVLMKFLKNMAQKNNMGILMSSHDLHLVEGYCDYVWLMGRDEQMISGSPAELASAGEFSKIFY